MLPVVYFLCSAAVHTATENWKLQFVLVTEKGVWVLSTVYSMPLTSWLGMWFEQEKLGTYTGSWPPCLAHGSAVDCPLKPQRTCSLLLPSGQSQQGQSVLGQHPSREVFHTHPEHGRELEAAAQAAAENWAQPTSAWSLFRWTSFHGLVVPDFHSLQVGGTCNFDLWELSLANRLFFLNNNGMSTANIPSGEYPFCG